MTPNTIYAGEDFALVGRLSSAPEESHFSLDDHTIDLSLSTTALGERIHCSSGCESGKLKIVKDNDTFYVNIPSALTSRLSAGKMIVALRVTNNKTGTVSIAQERIVDVLQSKKI